MNIRQSKENDSLTIFVEGKIDTNTAPAFLEYLQKELHGVAHLVIDLEKVDYISSAGLRTILFAQRTMNSQGDLVIRHVNEDIMETFELTGFVDILTIE